MRDGLGKSVTRTIVAVGLWAALHSLLATQAAKRRATRSLGPRTSNGLYRLTYNAVAITSAAALLLYLHRLPDQELYRLTGLTRTTATALRLWLVAIAIWSGFEIGIGPFSGFSEALHLLQGRLVAPAPEAQGPGADASYRGLTLRTSGPFRYVRHPLNASFAAVVFLMPRMTVVRLTVAVLTLLYSVIGSKLEEQRLLGMYGADYARYLASGVPFMVPRLLQPKIAGREL